MPATLPARDYDVIVIGSGFGGSVAALRLTEKGYRVAVLEAGRRFKDADFPRTSWNARKFFWRRSSAAWASSGFTCSGTSSSWRARASEARWCTPTRSTSLPTPRSRGRLPAPGTGRAAKSGRAAVGAGGATSGSTT